MARKMVDHIVKGKDVFIGLEDSKKSWKICVRTQGQIVHETSMSARFDLLRDHLCLYPDCRISLMYEAGFKGFNLFDQLSEIGVECVVLPPHLLTVQKVSRVKTDKHDARRLASLLASGDFSRCRVPDKERRYDRQIVRTLNTVDKDIKATRNRLRKELDFHGIDPHIDKQAWQKGEFRSLKKLPLDPVLRISVESKLRHLEFLWKEQLLLKNTLKEIAKKQRYKPSLKILTSFPGIGPLTAIRLVLEIGEDIATFESGKSVAAFLGLTGSEHSTGDTVRKGRITGMGNTFVRAWLIEAAWTAIRRDPALQEFYQRIRANSGSTKKAIVATARKMAVRIYTCMKKQTEYQMGIIQ